MRIRKPFDTLKLDDPVPTEEDRLGTYDEFVTAMQSDGWRFLDNKTPHIITNKDTKMVSTYPIIAGGYGPFLELKCPPDHILTINGANQKPLLRHYLSIRCRDDTNFELPGGTRLSIMYLDNTGRPRVNLWVSYDEISQTRGSRFKQDGERYYLKELGIRLSGGEKLAFYVYESDIDIVKTDILLSCDIFVKDEAGGRAE